MQPNVYFISLFLEITITITCNFWLQLLVGQSPFIFWDMFMTLKDIEASFQNPGNLGLWFVTYILLFWILSQLPLWQIGSNVFPQNYFWEPIWLSLVGRRRYNGDFSQEELAKFGYTKYEVRIFNQPFIYIWLNAENHIYKSAFFFYLSLLVIGSF